MHCIRRNFEKCTMGYFVNDRCGFPTKDTGKHWIEKCNFVFVVLSKVSSLDELSFGEQDHHSGWIVNAKMLNKPHQLIYVKNHIATSNSHIKKIFLTSISGSICQMTSEDFWNFVQEDLHKKEMKSSFVSSKCGKLQIPNTDTSVWIFPDKTLSETGHSINQEDIFVNKLTLAVRENGEKMNVPSIFPCPKAINDHSFKKLKKLGAAIENFYGPRNIHALHVISSCLKAINRDILLECEHQVSVVNLSGPANVGKTLACAIMLKMMGASSLMLSRCTASAMLDYAHIFQNMQIVWDDPRDCCASQICSIVHEAFHGHSTISVSKGSRSYNANLLIGTQNKLLGLPETTENLPTFSRLSHIDMNYPEYSYTSSFENEEKLKNMVDDNLNCFGNLLCVNYDINRVNKLHNKLLKDSRSQQIIPRCIRILAVDWYFCLEMNTFLHLSSNEIEDYFQNQLDYLVKICNKTDIFTQFCQHLTDLMQKTSIPSTFFKSKVTVDIDGLCECIAFYPKEFFPFLHANIPESSNYNVWDISKEIKNSQKKYGTISKNVSFKSEWGNIIRRAIVIKRDIVENSL